MALVLADRVRETSTTVGTGTLTLGGALASFQSFSVIGDTNTTYYTIVNRAASEWEVGIGTYTLSGTTLSRDTVLSSSNSGSLVNFSAGTKDVWGDYPAGKAVTTDTLAYPPVIGGTTPAAGTFTTLTANSTSQFGKSSANYVQIDGAATTLSPTISAQGSDTNVTLNFANKNSGNITFSTSSVVRSRLNGSDGSFDSGISSSGGIAVKATPTTNQVNYVQVTGAATGGKPTISAQGSDGNINIDINSKGSGFITFNSGSSAIMRMLGSASTANYATVSGSASGFGIPFSVAGTDTNISQVFQSKGTGAIDLAAGSSGVNISNGGTVTAITRTATGTNYTSPPTWTATAPTTAGGTQASGTTTLTLQTIIGIVTNGGSGYAVGDTFYVNGGTFGTQLRLQVATVSGSAVATVSSLNGGDYTVVPTNPASTTNIIGTGSGCTISPIWGVNTLAISVAGSGYVEQPTVSFSGGGGSGAAAYATVGSQTVVKSLGTTTGTITNQSMMFQTPSGNSLLLRDSAQATPDAHFMVQATANGYALAMAEGSNANASLYVGAKGTGSVRLSTSSTSLIEQARVSHTASAVNYVQVTGAATGGFPTISTQGSDASVALWLTTKGTSATRFLSQNGSYTQLRIDGSVASANSLNVIGGASGFGAVLSVQGADANIPLVLQPLGTGALQAQQTDSTATGGNARGANAVDWQTHRYGAGSVASGTYSVIGGGDGNTSGGYGSSLAGGVGNNASNNYSFVGGGNGNSAGNDRAIVAGGGSNSALGILNFIGGGFTNSGTTNTAVTTQSATMNGTTAVTLAASNASIKVGQYISGTSIAGDTYVAAISGTSLTLSKVASGSSTSTLSFYTPHGVVVGGGNNQATGSYSFIGGGGDAGTASNRNVASGDYSFVGGGRTNIASGIASVVVGGGFDGGSSALGHTASGTGSTVGGGLANAASGTGATVVGGYQSSATGAMSTILGGRYGNTRSIEGLAVISACNQPIASATGISQSAVLVIARQTTDATPTVLASSSSAATTNNQVILPNNSAYYFRGEVVAGVTGGGNTKGWTIEGLIKRGAGVGTTTLIGSTVTSSYADAGASTWTIALSADTTNGGLAVTFTGQAATTIRTVCSIRTTEMTY